MPSKKKDPKKQDLRLSKAFINAYRSDLDTAATSARLYICTLIDEMYATWPEASVAEMREATITAIEDTLDLFGSETARVTGELFDAITEQLGLEYEYEAYDGIDPDRIEEKVHWAAGKLVDDDDPLGYRETIGDVTAYYVKREAMESMVHNCERYNVRYARIPTGVESCSFCFMLASRGFVYHSEENAAHAHLHCDCIVVPGTFRTEVEGYDQKAYQARWRECRDAVAIPGHDIPAADIMREVERRGFDWAWTGQTAE